MEIAEQYRTNDLTAMTTGNLSESEEMSKTPAGERLLLSKKVPLISDSGEVEGLCGISTEITDLRRTELALSESIETLQRERDNTLLNVEAATLRSPTKYASPWQPFQWAALRQCDFLT
jgi:hypothetical protein